MQGVAGCRSAIAGIGRVMVKNYLAGANKKRYTLLCGTGERLRNAHYDVPVDTSGCLATNLRFVFTHRWAGTALYVSFIGRAATNLFLFVLRMKRVEMLRNS
jgi:hypothetical protein